MAETLAIRRIAPQPRVDTGPIRFGEDWPGVFFRGDDACGYATALDWVLKKHPELPSRSVLHELQILLRSSDISEK